MIRYEGPIIWDYEPEGEFDLSVGKLLLTTSGRLIIGSNKDIGSPYHERTVFPHRNFEVMTENSPRLRELAGRSLRNQNRTDYFIPTTITAGSGRVQYSKVDGGIVQNFELLGDNISARIDYVLFIDGNAAQIGSLRVLASANSYTLIDTSGSSLLQFAAEGISVNGQNGVGFTYTLGGGQNGTLLLRKFVIGEIKGEEEVVPTPPLNGPPVWVTPAGSLGLFTSSANVQLEVYDPDGDTITYAITSGYLPPGLTMSPSGKITGNVTQQSEEKNFTIEVTATDGIDEIARTFTLTVPAINKPPVWVTNAGVIANATNGQAFNFNFLATDPEGSNVTYRPATAAGVEVPFSSIIPGLSLNIATGAVTGTPTATGSYSFRVYAYDDKNARTLRNFTLTVAQPNLPPIWQSPPAGTLTTHGTTGQNFNLTLLALDPEGSAVTYKHALFTDVEVPIGSVIPGLTLNETTGAISGIPTTPGTISFRIHAYDNLMAMAVRDFTLTIEAANQPPVWQSPNAGSLPLAPLGQELTYSFTATDPEGLTVTYKAATSTGIEVASFASLVPGLSLGADGTLTGIPTASGQYSFRIHAYDPQGAMTPRLFSLKVAVVNNPPVWQTPAFLGDFNAGDVVDIQLAAYDPDGGTLTYSATYLPPGITLSADGHITGTAPPNLTQSNVSTANALYINVTDSTGLVTTRLFSIRVYTP